MDTVKKLISWLQDAHSVEQHSEKVFESYAASPGDYPVLKAKLNEHLAVNRRHKERVEDGLRSLGGSPSGLGSAVAKILGVSQTAASTLLGDAVLTNCAAAYALEHLGVATYASIAAAAEKVGRHDIARTCREIMTEDSAMAAWLLEQLPQLTQRYLDRPE